MLSYGNIKISKCLSCEPHFLHINSHGVLFHDLPTWMTSLEKIANFLRTLTFWKKQMPLILNSSCENNIRPVHCWIIRSCADVLVFHYYLSAFLREKAFTKPISLAEITSFDLFSMEPKKGPPLKKSNFRSECRKNIVKMPFW